MIGLPTLGELDRSTLVRIWLATAPADMRCGFDRLAELAQSVTDQNPMDGHLFLFRGRNGDRLKILHWDKDGKPLTPPHNQISYQLARRTIPVFHSATTTLRLFHYRRLKCNKARNIFKVDDSGPLQLVQDWMPKVPAIKIKCRFAPWIFLNHRQRR